MQSNKKQSDFSVVILAAGTSYRMGVPKFSLVYSDNSTFLEHIINEYMDFGCKEIVAVINENDFSCLGKKINIPPDIKIAINRHPEWDRFYSLKTGLQGVGKIQPAFVLNVDNPFVNPQVNLALMEELGEADYICPVYRGRGGHPLLLSQKIVLDIVHEKTNQLHFKEFLTRYAKKTIGVEDEKILININTPEDYRYVFVAGKPTEI